MEQEEYESLIIRSLTRTSTAEEESVLNAWRTASSANEKMYSEYERLYRLSEAADPPPVDASSEWQRLKAKLSIPSEKTISISLSPWSIAATIALIIASAFLIREMTREREVVHFSEDGEMSLKLHDGSTIIMKPNTVIRHSTSFNDGRRELTLEGSAYFDVASHPDRPFVITTKGSRVRVLGTAFMLVAKANANHIEVKEGRVSYSRPGGEEVTLSAGDMAKMDSTGTIHRARISPDNILAWKDRKLVFRGTSLDEIAFVASSYFDVTISFSDPALGSCRFTGTFEDPSLEELLEAISEAVDVSVVRDKNRIILSGPGCR